ncbi:MAG: hypothetical protein VXW32_10585 [Myxococcota bacterium]|nr:hypothetical protein [Myxococcota bacterium]
MKRFWPSAFMAMTLVACSSGNTDSGPGDDTGASSEDPAVLTIVSPADGAVVTEGDSVLLSAEARGSVSGDVLAMDALEWGTNVGDWMVSGNDVSVSDFPVGSLQLIATASISGREVVAAVDLVVEPRRYDLSGRIDAAVELYSNEWNYTFEDDCNGTMVFVIEGAAVSGTGSCEAFDEPIEFLVTGTESNGQVTGEMGVSGGEENVPFTASWDSEAEVLEGAFDQTWGSDDGTLRMVGTFSASTE